LGALQLVGCGGVQLAAVAGAIVGQGMAFEPGPQVIHWVEVGGVRGQECNLNVPALPKYPRNSRLRCVLNPSQITAGRCLKCSLSARQLDRFNRLSFRVNRRNCLFAFSLIVLSCGHIWIWVDAHANLPARARWKRESGCGSCGSNQAGAASALHDRRVSCFQTQ